MPPVAAFLQVALDARDRHRLGRFWAAALGLEAAEHDGSVVLRGPTPQHTVWIDHVPEPKTVKHRMHLDVYTRSVDELVGLGATVVRTLPRWTLMTDPEGGEFCAFVRPDPGPYRLYEVVLDAADPRRIARWWADVLGARYVDEGEDFVHLADIPGAPFETLDVQPVPEPRSAKNRVHFDVTAPSVGALLDRGATLLTPRGDLPWDVLADPEGNEFCAFPPDTP